MIEWRDEGVLIAVRRHGETAAIIEVLTQGHGRVAGVVRGGGGRRMAPILQPGAQLDVTWKARLDEHLGHFTVEPLRSRAAQIMGDRGALVRLNALTAMVGYAVPERDPLDGIYARTEPLFDLLTQGDVWPLAYLRWELALLDALGYGLDLSRCAVTGAVDGLVYISPRTGCAVSAPGAGEWAERMLPLSPAMTGAPCDDGDVTQALRVTEHFFETKLVPVLGRPVPAARARFIAQLTPA